MQTILVPVDFSPVSRNAAVYAAELARIFNSRLVLFHAYMLPTPVSEVPYVMVTADEMQQENETLLKKRQSTCILPMAYRLNLLSVSVLLRTKSKNSPKSSLLT